MKKNLLLAILCMLGLLGTLNAQENVVTINGKVGDCEETTSMYVPIYNNYEYSVTQFYYTAEEIGKAGGTIESIAFKTDGNADDSGKYPYSRTIDVYMQNDKENYHFGVGGRTSKTISDDFKVFSGTVSFTQDSWVTIDLDTDFEYEGGHLFVCINDYTGEYIAGGGALFEAFNCNYNFDGLAYRALYKGNKSSKYDLNTSVQLTQSKPVPFAKLTFAEGSAEEFVAPATPENFKAEALSESKIRLTWDALTENVQSYNVYSGTELLANVTEAEYVIKNLELGEYCYTVTALNGTFESASTAQECITLVERDLESLVVGTIGDIDASAVPFGNGVNNSWVEHVYTADEIGQACTIEKISFAHRNGNPITTKEIKIYLAETTKTNYADKTWTAEDDLTLVYSDTDIIIGEQEWETFEFTTPFVYSGEKNLAVVVAKSSDETNNLLFWYCSEVENSVLVATDVSEYPSATTASAAYGKRPVAKFSYSEGTPSQPEEEAYLIKEYFDGFEVGDKVAEKGNAWWTTWNKKPGTSQDGVIVELDGNKVAHMKYGNDQVLLLGDQQNGVYDLEFDILVPDGKSGYFNVLHEFDGDNSLWAVEAYLHMTSDATGSGQEFAAGHGTLHAGAVEAADVACVYDEWMHFRLHIDTDIDKAQYYYTAPGAEEVMIWEWQWSLDCFGDATVGRKLAAMNFCPIFEQSEYYLDNFTLKKIGGESAPELDFSAESLEASAKEDDMTTVELTLENTGTSIAEYVAWVDYGMGEISTEENYIYYDSELSEQSMMTGFNITVEEVFEIAAMYPATSYGNSAAGTYITTLAYPFMRTQEGTIGIVEGSEVIFRIYGQGLYGQPGKVLAEKVLTYDEIVAAIDEEQWTFAEFDEPVALTGYDVWASMTFTHAVSTETAPQLPFVFDGNSTSYVAEGSLFRSGNSGPFYNVNDLFTQARGNFHFRMISVGDPVVGGWAELDKTEGAIPVGATETISVDLTSIGLKAGETYEAKVVFTTNVAEKETVEIPLTLNVVADDNVEEVLSNAYSIYPNPTSAQVMVEGENINYIAVYNSVGQLVNVVKTSSNIVDMSNYDNGVYYFNIVDNAGQSAVQRVVVAK